MSTLELTIHDNDDREITVEVWYTPYRPAPAYRAVGDANYCDPGDAEELEICNAYYADEPRCLIPQEYFEENEHHEDELLEQARSHYESRW